MARYDGTLKFDTKIDTSKFKKQLNSLKNIAGKAISAVGKSAAALGGVFAGAATGALALVEKTKELNGDLGKFNANVQASGKSQEFMNEQLKRFTAITGEADSSIEGLSNLLRTTYKEDRLKQVLDGLAGAVVAFPDTLKFESLSDSLQETLATGKGVGQFAELLERSGQNLEQFNDKLAAAPDQMTKNTIALQALNDTGLAKLAKNYEETNKEQLEYSKNQQDLQRITADMASELVPIVNKIFPSVIKLLGKVRDKTKQLAKPISDVVTHFVNMVSGVDGAGEDLLKSVGNILNNLKEKVIELVPQITQKITGIIDQATEYFKSDEGKQKLGDGITELFNSAIELLKDIPSMITSMGNLISEMVDGLFEDTNFDKMVEGLTKFIEDVVLETSFAIFTAGGKIALKLIEGIVHQLKRGKDKVKEVLESWGIGSTAEDSLSHYGSGGSGASSGFEAFDRNRYNTVLNNAINAGRPHFSYEEYKAAGSHEPGSKWDTSIKKSSPVTINITGQKVLNPVDTAREVKKVFTSDLARGY